MKKINSTHFPDPKEENHIITFQALSFSSDNCQRSEEKAIEWNRH